MNYEHDEPDSFTAGTVGPPGRRVFYLQSRHGTELVSLRLEKQQVRALAEYLAGLLADLPAVGTVPDAAELVEPVIPAWTVGNIGVAYDNERDRVVVVAEELVLPDEDDDVDLDDAEVELATGDEARFTLTREQVKAFIHRTAFLMQGGRPPCQVCGMPMDLEGHICPRAN